MTLLLVRHGQASFGATDYDNLSERGHEQSRRLGEWLLRGGHRFEAVVVGGMRRHQQTAEGVAAVFADQGQPLPEPVVDAMLAHPVLMNRPFVVTPEGVRLCRPPETVREIL